MQNIVKKLSPIFFLFIWFGLKELSFAQRQGLFQHTEIQGSNPDTNVNACQGTFAYYLRNSNMSFN